MTDTPRIAAFLRLALPAALVLLAGACGRSAESGAGVPPAADAREGAPAPRVDTDPGKVVARYAAGDAGEAAALPEDIVRGLSTDGHVLDCAGGVRDGASRFAADWVAARRIDLDGDGDGDWVVNGRHDCLREGGAADWWLYAENGSSRRRLLAVDGADAIEIADSRTQGFHDLRVTRGGQVDAAVYDGQGYALQAATAQGAGAAAAPAAVGDGPVAGEALPSGRFEDTKSVETVAGRLEAVPTALDLGRDDHVLRLAGKELLRTGEGQAFAGFPITQPKLRYAGIAPFDEVIVMQQFSRGNACNGGPLWILGLKRDGSHRASEPIDYCGGADPVFAATPEQLTITLPGGARNRGEGRVPAQTWVYRDGRLSRVDAPASSP